MKIKYVLKRVFAGVKVLSFNVCPNFVDKVFPFVCP